jgi:hypothetical protein
MSTQSVTACPPLKWPADLGTIGLREEDVRIYNAAIPLIVPHVPPGGYSVLERQITLPPWRAANPRRVLLNNGTFILLVLNRKGGVPTTAGGASQKPMKLAFDLVSGKPCLKKTIGSIAEEMLVRLICKYKIKGFADIVCVERRKGGKVIYF